MTTIQRGAFILATCVLFAIIALAATNALTKKRILETQKQWRQKTLFAILPDTTFDQDPLSNEHFIRTDALSMSGPVPVYPVFVEEKPYAAILTLDAPDGYNGNIRILLGIRVDGVVLGARVLEHHETPGLGDDIELKRSDWILGFNGKSLNTSPTEDWTVRKLGGTFDAFTGATITPRAVINAVHRALRWFENNTMQVFQP